MPLLAEGLCLGNLFTHEIYIFTLTEYEWPKKKQFAVSALKLVLLALPSHLSFPPTNIFDVKSYAAESPRVLAPSVSFVIGSLLLGSVDTSC